MSMAGRESRFSRKRSGRWLKFQTILAAWHFSLLLLFSSHKLRSSMFCAIRKTIWCIYVTMTHSI